MQQEITSLVDKYQVVDPYNASYTGKMLWTVWCDGELTLQKAGILWGTRTEHMIEGGVKKSIYYTLPNTLNWWTYVVIDDDNAARALRALLIL